eukprot:RCo000790
MVFLSLQIESTLGRSLCEDERKVLASLSVQGMAKLNSDACRGPSCLEASLGDLTEVFHLAQQRKADLEAALPEGAWATARRMGRPPTVDELLMLSEVPLGAVLFRINEELQKGIELEDALEELAQAHLQRRLYRDAQRLAESVKNHVSISRLAPTRRALGGDLLSPSAAQFFVHRIRVGLSAVQTWFEDSMRSAPEPISLPLTGFLASEDEQGLTPSPKSVLKRPRRSVGSEDSPKTRELHVSFCSSSSLASGSMEGSEPETSL